MKIFNWLFLALMVVVVPVYAEPHDPGMKYQYAVKFVCGKADGRVAVKGNYRTAINLHNPSYRDVKFVFKVAIALPNLKEGPITEFKSASLGADGAAEIDCPDIWRRLDWNADRWAKGFVVIATDDELDVVGVYTATGPDRRTIALELERVEPRTHSTNTKVDLLPAPDANGGFCRRRDNNLIVTIRNQGSGVAAPSTTRIDFSTGSLVDVPTPMLAAGAQTDLIVPIPAGCFSPDCGFVIYADFFSVVGEIDEINNKATGVCIG